MSPMSPSKAPILVRDLDSRAIHRFLDTFESAPKRHLGRFSCFCTAHPYAQHSHRQLRQADRHRPTTLRVRICSNKPHLCIACKRRGPIITLTTWCVLRFDTETLLIPATVGINFHNSTSWWVVKSRPCPSLALRRTSSCTCAVGYVCVLTCSS